jgi:MtrB/PioB family decaheme-associated outer membrane protein
MRELPFPNPWIEPPLGEQISTVTSMRTIRFVALAFALLPRPSLHAQEGNSERGILEIGARGLAGDRNSSKFDEYRDLSPGFFVQRFETRLEHLFQSNYFFNFQTRKSLDNDQSFRASFGNYGKFHFDVKWDATPHDFTNAASTLYTQSSPGVFTFPSALRTSLQSNPAGLASILNGATAMDVSLKRRLGSGTFEYTPAAAWGLMLQYSREAEDGYRPFGTALNGMNNALEMTEPVNYRTQQLKAGVEYGGSRGGFQASFTRSDFSNQVGELVWDNPFRTTDASGNGARGRIDLYPDNSSQGMVFAGAFNLSDSTRLMGSVSPEWMHQNDALLPFTINSAVTGIAPLPATSLNGSKQRLAMNYTVASHPLAALSLTAHYRSYDYQNNTPSLLFPSYVQTDSSLSTLTRRSLPYAFNRQNAGLDATWLLHKGETLTFGYEFENLDRQHRDVAVSREHTGSVTLDLNPKKWVLLRASYRHSERTPSNYVANEEINPLGEGPNAIPMPDGWRKFDEAARTRNRADGLIELDATDRLSFTASYGMTQDRYHDSQYGLLGYRTMDSTLDASYQLHPNISLFGEYAYERYKSDQRSRQYSTTVNTTNNDWESYLRDGIHTVGTGISFSGFRKKASLDTFYSLSMAKGQINTRVLGNPLLPTFQITTAQDYPETINRIHALTGAVRYQLSSHVYSRIEYRYERYDRVDFQVAGMSPYMVPMDSRTNTSIFLGADVPGYQVHIVSVSLEYRF